MENTRMKKISLLLILGLFSSCSSTTKLAAPELEVVETKDGRVVGGVVVYNPHGLKQLVDARRNQAFKRMREVCQPLTFRITNEENAKPEEKNKKYSGNITAITGNTVRFVEYRCEKP